jgi:hypothetical protein
MKKTRLSRIGGDSSSRQPSADALATSSLRDLEWAGRTTGASPWIARKSAAATPSSAEQRKAPRHPTASCIDRSITGAMAEPIIPEQVWNEKTWVMRRGDTRSERRA